MSLAKTYNFKEYSIFDIQKYLEESGYKTKLYKDGDVDENYLEWKNLNKPDDGWIRKIAGDMIGVVGTDVYIDIAHYNKNANQVFAHLRFENYPKTKNYEESKKIYKKLCNKFGRSSQEKGWSGRICIKDEDKIVDYVKKQKKTWWKIGGVD